VFGVSMRLVNVDRDSPMLLPPDLRDWVPANHVAHFLIDAVAALALRGFRVNLGGTGGEPYPPSLPRNAS